MNRLILVAAATFAFPALAFAADAPAYAEASNMYVSLHGGMLMDPSMDTKIAPSAGADATLPVSFGFDSGMRWGGAVGYSLNSALAMELEYSNASFDAEDGEVSGSTYDADGDANVQTIMANFLVGADYGSFRPYIGAGLGGARVAADISPAFTSDDLDDSDWVLAGQAFAGVNVALSETMTIGARYRYQMIGATDMTDGRGDPIAGESFDLQSVDLVLTVGF